jgi:hypothetical protein
MQTLTALFAHMEEELEDSAAHEVAAALATYIAREGGDNLVWLIDIEEAHRVAYSSPDAIKHWVTTVYDFLDLMPEDLDTLIMQGFLTIKSYLNNSIDIDTVFCIAQRIEATLRVVDTESARWVQDFHDTKRRSEHPRSDKTAWMLFIAETLSKNRLNS